MKAYQEYIIRKKLPTLLLGIIEYKGTADIMQKCNCTALELLQWITAEQFPTHVQLRLFAIDTERVTLH